MNNTTRKIALALALALSLGGPAGAQNLTSLRGADVSAPEPAPADIRMGPDRAPLPRE